MKLKFKEYSGKPDKNRLINAMKGEPVDRVPNFEVLIEDQIVEKILGRSIGSSALGSIDDVSKNAINKAEKVHKNLDMDSEKETRPVYAKDYAELCERIGQDAIVLGEWYAPFLAIDKDGRKVAVRNKDFKNRKDIKNRMIMPSENMDYFKRIEPFLKEYQEEAGKKNLAVMVSIGDLLQQIYEFIFGIEDFSYLLYDDLSLIEELIEEGVNYWTGFSKYLVAQNTDLICFADDVAYKSGLFIQHKMFKKIYLSRYKRILEPVVNAGKPIWFHSDGKIYEILDDLINMGVTCINPMEPYSMDYKYLKQRYGKKLTLMGNIDVGFPLSEGTPEDVRKDIEEHMKVLKPGYRYIAATSHSMGNYIPDENIVAFFDAIHEFGVY
ncbi:MAG: uroporphyrinogen decarboxylase family protein [Candidatus Humimicrobiaceae bacterium]